MRPRGTPGGLGRWKAVTVSVLALSSTILACSNRAPAVERDAKSQSFALVGNGQVEATEQCDDGNTVSGDGCSASGTIEAGYLCQVPGRPCSLASLCGNNVVDPGEACDDGNTTESGNGCTASCGLSLCGNGVLNNRQFPNFDQETCDDGNTVEGDGCSRLCEVEPGFSCTGTPSRCVTSGVELFGTGLGANGRRLESGLDPHWFYAATGVAAATDVRSANDWPQEVQTARFMSAPSGAPVCVSQDFLLPSTLNPSTFRMRIATFNDNAFDSAKVNGVSFTPTIVSQPAGQPWQKNIIREFGASAPWRSGLNRITLCNENEASEPNAFRYIFVDAYDDRCGDGVVSSREECDDGNVTNGDGCNATCGIESGYACAGAPSACAATCGNGVLEASEECDDGNKASGDGCSTSCRVESGRACPVPGAPCLATCGNGSLDAGEKCDDGNATNGDGCSSACRIERGYECKGAPSNCARPCGNGRLDPGEQCDDGNLAFGDGCSSACTLELGYACPVVAAPCVKTCGNGSVDAGEQCDDGNLASGDGCGSVCQPELGYTCSRPAAGPSVCIVTCGNGVADANETCDDGNLRTGDGCDGTCVVEPGYRCVGSPSVCSEACGDGIVTASETCDDGNANPNDGCDASCRVETGFGCQNTGVHAVFTRLGRTNCTQVGDITSPTLDEATIQSALTTPGRYRARYVSGAVQYSAGGSWYPGVFGVNYQTDVGTFRSSLGYTGAGAPTAAGAVAQGVGQQLDFDATTGDVRLALVDVDCALNDNSDTPVTYRVDAMSICQKVPSLTKPAPGQVSNGNVEGSASPSATVRVYLDEATTPSCTVTADKDGHWSCSLGAASGTHSVVVESTIVSATETAASVNITIDATTTKPTFTAPAQGAFLANATPSLSGTAEAASQVTVTEGVTTICTATASAGSTWSCTPTTALAEGAHSLTATAADVAGNVSESDPLAFTIDTHPPDTSFTKQPSAHTTDRIASFAYASTEGDAHFECSLDDSAFAPCSGTYTVALGAHVLRARAVDKAGNVDATPAEARWVVDDGSTPDASTPVTPVDPGTPATPEPVAGTDEGGCSAAPSSVSHGAPWFVVLGLLCLRRPRKRAQLDR